MFIERDDPAGVNARGPTLRLISATRRTVGAPKGGASLGTTAGLRRPREVASRGGAAQSTAAAMVGLCEAAKTAYTAEYRSARGAKIEDTVTATARGLMRGAFFPAALSNRCVFIPHLATAHGMSAQHRERQNESFDKASPSANRLTTPAVPMTPTASNDNAGQSESGRRYWFGRRVAIIGKPAEGARRSLIELFRGQGAVVQRRPNSRTELIVLAGSAIQADRERLAEQLDPRAAAALRAGRIDVVDEAEARRRAAGECDAADVLRLYTPAMLARMVGAEAWTIRRWARRGWLRPVRQVRHVYYFDRDAAQAAQRLALLCAQGTSPHAIKTQIESLRRRFPEAGDPLHGPNWSVAAGRIVYHGPTGPAQADGQRLFGFSFSPQVDLLLVPKTRSKTRAETPAAAAAGMSSDVLDSGKAAFSEASFAATDAAATGSSSRTRWLFASEAEQCPGAGAERAAAAADIACAAGGAGGSARAGASEPATEVLRPGAEAREESGRKESSDPPAAAMARTAAELLSGRKVALPTHAGHLAHLAAELEDDGQWAAAAEMYRAAMAAGGPTAELCFQTAELLYRMGDLNGARERYYMALELDEEFVEARISLGCVLIELGQNDLAEAAFRGTLRYHPHFADGHYFLARLLDKRGEAAEAERHWRAFLDLAPDSPWADEARQRLAPPTG